MACSEALEDDLEELEAAAIDLIRRQESADADATDEQQFVGVIDHVTNTYPIPAGSTRAHAEHISRMYRARTNDTAVRKRIATERHLFLREHCEGYDPQF
ncbi:hypothetical protein GCM10008995_26980 [Halobellus salinus]|uniref:Uncharacterized protein n=1 Tax=Halobellus salinus TaxID=931585 RepID=A0A830EKZ4_9EURY|nr:hypothetical protein [Halobellus salinus]GGJ15764.1 hypothetical protein GCM10008995_26980 [Halobellus salinus]SMP33075.1 hypothetical protein SAMN06265347_12236 [Halobellus salinus]